MKVEVLIDIHYDGDEDDMMNCLQEAIEDAYPEIINGRGVREDMPVSVIGIKPSEVL